MSNSEEKSTNTNAKPDANERHSGRQIAETQTDQDSAWKEVIERLFEPFTEFFFPQIHKDIDFSKGIEILDAKSTGITPYGKVGKRYADELVKVHLKDGSTACVCVFIHVEVQGSRERIGVFPERTYVYNYRVYDKNIDKGIKVVSVAILTDADANYRPDEYLVQQWGFELRMKIPMVKIIDYKYIEELRDKLETSDNPMAMVVKAQLKSHELKKTDINRKSTIKWELIRECYKKGHTKKDIRVLLKFIDWLIRLPVGLTKQLNMKISKLEEDYKMPYVTSWERVAKKEGEKIGKLDAAREFLKNGVDIDIVVKSTGFSRKEIERLAKTVQAKTVH
jgi:hypothetical protein